MKFFNLRLRNLSNNQVTRTEELIMPYKPQKNLCVTDFQLYEAMNVMV